MCLQKAEITEKLKKITQAVAIYREPEKPTKPLENLPTILGSHDHGMTTLRST